MLVLHSSTFTRPFHVPQFRPLRSLEEGKGIEADPRNRRTGGAQLSDATPGWVLHPHHFSPQENALSISHNLPPCQVLEIPRLPSGDSQSEKEDGHRHKCDKCYRSGKTRGGSVSQQFILVTPFSSLFPP